MFEVRYVDSRVADQIVAECDMIVDSRHDVESAAEDRREDIEATIPGGRAWIYEVA